MNKDWLDIELLEDYLDGKLEGNVMHQIEKQALEDPFVAQALAGLAESPKRASQNISLLQKQLYERIGQQNVVKKQSVYTWQRLSIAAAAAVLFITVSLIYFMREDSRRAELAKANNRPKNIEVSIAPSVAAIDSVVGEVYANNKTPLQELSPLDVGKTNPRRNINEKPIITTATELADGIQNTATADSSSNVQSSAAMSRAASVTLSTVQPLVSSPEGGWAKLEAYITANNKLALEGNSGKIVELSFLISPEGRPTSIKVEKGAAADLVEEAIRLINDGPKWEQPTTEGTRVKYTVVF